jgi:hypothetical protein
LLRLPPPYDPREIVVSTLGLNGISAPPPASIAFEDDDGVPEMILRIDRDALAAVLPAGPGFPLTITGEVRDRTWFRGTAILRVIASHAPGL